MKNLPLGISSLAKLLNNDCVYVDKTGFAHRLVKQPGAFFLSRPRRFGKSLFIDTLKEIFEGNQALFQGLYIHDRWDWSKTWPVIKLDFAGGVIQNRQALDQRIESILRQNSERLGVGWGENEDIPGQLSGLIRHAVQHCGQSAVVLVDEYDKPILDNLDKPEIAAEIREGLKNLYSVLKEQDANLQFVFMTGVSKFSKVSLFSGINQLKDITLSAATSALCGYTEEELRRCFGEHLEGVDWNRMRYWYNGYGWTGQETVYNPYDILLFISEDFRFRSYWFETGSPAFLIRLFRQKQYFLPDLESLEVSEEILDSFEVERINPVTLLFQAGYLTIERSFTAIEQIFFKLRVPNYEVRAALNSQLISAYTDLVNEKSGLQRQLHDCLLEGRLEALENLIKRLFAGIPWRNLTHNNLPDYEGYYASVLYAFFASLDARIIPEDISCHGQADLTVIVGHQVYVMEFKVIDAETSDDNPALEQIKQRHYADKYRAEPGKQVHEAGFIFSRALRGLVRVDWGEALQ
jgi:hypothetical protein